MRSSGRLLGATALLLGCVAGVAGQDLPAIPPAPAPEFADRQPVGRQFPIDLATALRLAGVNPLDIALAAERLQIASAQYDRARLLWVPNLTLGVDYFRHDGQIQDIVGNVFFTRRSSFFAGGGPGLSVAIGDALYAPLAARQVIQARQADVQAARNDSTLAVAEAYFAVQQARGEVAGAIESERRARELVRRSEQLAPGLVPNVEINRAKTELARRRQAVEAAYERWQVASADLTRLLRLDPTTVIEPAEAPDLRVELVNAACPVDELIPVALTSRPELASQQSLVQATLARLKQERIRPLVPSVVLRGVGSNTPGMSTGYFGGGVNGSLNNFGDRNSIDLQLIWQLDNLGLGNRAAVRERQAENRLAVLELMRTQDRVAAEVVQAQTRAQRASNRVREAEEGVRNAVETAEKNLQGLGQTKRAGEQLVLVFRPQEAVAAVTALDQAYRDYYGAVADANRAQFQLYRALGQPAQALTQTVAPPVAPQQPPAPPADGSVHHPAALPNWTRPLTAPPSQPQPGSPVPAPLGPAGR